MISTRQRYEEKKIIRFTLVTIAQICSLTNHSLPNMRDVVEAAAEGAREGFTEAVVNAAVEHHDRESW